jgi:hypothetical protein
MPLYSFLPLFVKAKITKNIYIFNRIGEMDFKILWVNIEEYRIWVST